MQKCKIWIMELIDIIKIKVWYFWIFQNLEKYVWDSECILYNKLILEYRSRIRCIWLYMGTWFNNICWDCLKTKSKNVPEVSTIFIRTICLRCVGIFGFKWCPYVAKSKTRALPLRPNYFLQSSIIHPQILFSRKHL